MSQLGGKTFRRFLKNRPEAKSIVHLTKRTFGRFVWLFLLFGVVFDDLRIDEVDHILRDVRGVVGKPFEVT